MNISNRSLILLQWLVLLTFSSLLLVISALRGFAAPPGGQWETIPELSDEFNEGTLDNTKWWPNNPQFNGRKPGYFSAKNVVVANGTLQITMKKEYLPNLPVGYNTYTCGAVKSKVRVLYGYFEARCKSMKAHGDNAFWFYDKSPTWWTEIDVFEITAFLPGKQQFVSTNVHVFYTPQNGGSKSVPTENSLKLLTAFNPADDFHVYALDWEPDVLMYYIDGTLVRAIPNTNWHQPLYMDFDIETLPSWLPEDSNLPDIFYVDYVRSWRKTNKVSNTPKNVLPSDVPVNK